MADDKASSPLVSIMMPAYNAQKTIAFALASLLAQTYPNWECIVVDDGSIDDTIKKVQSFQDPRIHVVKLGKNQGRGVARQRALEEVRGEFIGMLDADDWIYPDKLEKQVRVLLDNKDVSLVSSGMAIIDSSNNLCGIRCLGNGKKQVYSKPGRVPVAHAPSIFRKKEVGSICYDFRLKLSQDVDFLRNYLLGRKYLVLPCIGYAYREVGRSRLQRTIKGYFFNIYGLTKFITMRPFLIGIEIVKELWKILLTVLISSLGLFNYLIQKRSRRPFNVEESEFGIARNNIEKLIERYHFVDNQR